MRVAVRQLAGSGARDAVVEAARSRPFLGICIGLQMLFESSEEGPTRGLGVLPGKVVRFQMPPDFHRAMLGSSYRDLWSTPVTVEVLRPEAAAP